MHKKILALALLLPTLATADPMKELTESELETMANGLAGDLRSCLNRKPEKSLEIEVTNRTDEYLDKAKVEAILRHGLEANPGSGHVKKYTIRARIVSEKSQTGQHYKAVYRIQAEAFLGTKKICAKDSFLEKRSP